MSLYHYNQSIVQRSNGSSATKATAYIIGDKVHDDILNRTYNYSHKEEVVAHGLETPEQFPDELRGFSELSSAIERSEKSSKAQLAVRGNVALPACNSLEENIALVKEHIKPWKEQGFAVIWGVHMKDGNPHFHYLIPQRRVEMKDDGSWKWAAKYHKEYQIKIDGVVQKEYVTPAQFKELKATGIDVEKIKGGKDNKPISRAVREGFDSSKEALCADRERWAELYNKSTADHYTNLGIDNPEEPVSHLSYEARGMDRIATIHEGPNPFPDAVEYNTFAREYNKRAAELEQEVAQLQEQIASLRVEIKDEISAALDVIKQAPQIVRKRGLAAREDSFTSQLRNHVREASVKSQEVSKLNRDVQIKEQELKEYSPFDDIPDFNKAVKAQDANRNQKNRTLPDR